MTYISTDEALQICKKNGAATCSQTIRVWCRVYGIGIKVAGRYRIDKAKLDELIKGQSCTIVAIENLPFCKCGCGMRVTLPQNKYVLGHSRYPYRRYKNEYVQNKK